MNNQNPARTATMASLYARQGYIQKALDIYNQLLVAEPERRDVIEAIAELESGCQKKGDKQLCDLLPLFSEWINLMLCHITLEKLNRLRLLKNPNEK